jgi:hypothetical protein
VEEKQRFSMLQQVVHSCHWTLNAEGYFWAESVIDPTNHVRKAVLFCAKKDACHCSILKIKLEEGSPLNCEIKEQYSCILEGWVCVFVLLPSLRNPLSTPPSVI